MKYIKFFFLSILTVVNLPAQSNLVDKIEKLQTSSFFERSIAAIDVFNLTKNEPVYSENKKLLLHSASNMKIITSASFLYFLGEDHSFKTSVYYEGEVLDSVLFGDIYFKGGFDPDFTIADLDSVIYEIKKYGIKLITGNLYGDISSADSIYWGKGWMWDDDPETDFPYMTSLIINDAAVKAVFSPANIGEPAEVEIIPKSDFYSFQNFSKTTDADTNNFIITRDWVHHNNNIYAKGMLPVSEKPDTVGINLLNPAQYFLTLTKEHLKQSGISSGGKTAIKKVPENAQEVFTFERPFSEVIVNLNKKSDNLSAEMTLRLLGYEMYDSTASAELGIKAVDSLISIIGLNPEDYRIVDGSGVSHYNLVSAELLNELLKFFYFKENSLYEVLKNSFPIAGTDGTLENRAKYSSTFENVYAKTGTLSGVSCLSGYLKNKSGDDISFSIMMQNFTGSSKEARYLQDQICRIIAESE